MNNTPQPSFRIDPTLTLALAQASLAAYNDYERKPFKAPDNYIYWARFTGWDDWFSTYGQEERFGLIFKYVGPENVKNRFIVAFRGTSSIADLYEDANFELEAFKPFSNTVSPVANVSSGFNSIYATKGGNMKLTMQQQIFTALAPTASEIFITGHSLGGALSQLFTLDMRVSLPTVRIGTINFASPMVGDASWQTACNNAGATGKIIRVANYWDIIPTFPWYVPGYVSIGREFNIAFSSIFGTVDALSDHSLLNYQTVLNHCVWLNPQVWVGHFIDAVYGLRMSSTAVPSVAKETWLSTLKEIHEMKRSLLATNEIAEREIVLFEE
ncbi:lipase family protein [Chitinophaga sp. S165]|uniref:lipase family protein n=1 Tax=Chitinophaga sp. S165 TaxID=2135462 RepID=UPI000D71D918|nr:lipase family protein [Chitinophaga sp. S165]PWV50605.1 lipase (class 3) [Chitinophaga sp. S165]